MDENPVPNNTPSAGAEDGELDIAHNSVPSAPTPSESPNVPQDAFHQPAIINPSTTTPAPTQAMPEITPQVVSPPAPTVNNPVVPSMPTQPSVNPTAPPAEPIKMPWEGTRSTFDQKQDSMLQKSGLFNKVFKNRKLYLIVAGLIVLLGGSAEAYYGVILPNKPNNVVVSAVSNLYSSNQPGSFDISVISKNSNSEALGSDVTVSAKGGYDANQNIKADVRVEVSAFKLTSSFIVRPKDKEMYVKVEELPALLQTIAGSQSSPSLDALAKKLDANWLRVSADDLKTAGYLTTEQATMANKCIDGYNTYLTGQRDTLKSNLTSAYKANMFIKATKAGTETINGVKTTKYKLEIDQSKAHNFSMALDKQSSAATQTLEKDCGVTTSDAAMNDSTDMAATDSSSSAKLGDMFLWVGPKKKLIKFATSVSDNGSTTNISASFGSEKVDTAKPTNYITIKDIQDLLSKSLPTATDLQGEVFNF